MKIKKIINIVIMLVFLATIVYAKDNLCENKPNPCFKELEGVNEKIEKLKELKVGDTNYKELQEKSEDITVSIESLYEEASMYKNLALLRTQIEGLPKEVLKELKELKVGVAKKKSKTSKKIQEDKSEATTKVTTPTIEEQLQNPERSSDIVLEGDGRNYIIFFKKGEWYYCKTKMHSDSCSGVSIKVVTVTPEVRKTEYNEFLKNLDGKNYADGIDVILIKLLEARGGYKTIEIKIKTVDETVTSENKPKTKEIDVEIGNEIFPGAVKIKDIKTMKLEKNSNYKKALENFQIKAYSKETGEVLNPLIVDEEANKDVIKAGGGPI